MRIAERLGLVLLCLLFTVIVWPFLWELNALTTPHIPWTLLPVAALTVCLLVRGAAYTKGSLKPASARTLAIAVSAGALIAVSQVGTYLACSALFGGPAMTPGYLTILPWVIAAAFCATDSLVSGVVEEFAFRGLLQPEIERAMGRFIAIALTSVLFVASHSLKPGFAHVAPHFLLVSIVYGYIASKTQSFVVVAIAHTIHNILAYLVAFSTAGFLLEPAANAQLLGAVSLSLLAMTVAATVRYWPKVLPLRAG